MTQIEMIKPENYLQMARHLCHFNYNAELKEKLTERGKTFNFFDSIAGPKWRWLLKVE